MYMKPVVLLAIDNDITKGSARIPQGLSLYNAISRCGDLLVSFGGHELAAGLSLKTENIEEFSKKFEKVIFEMKQDDFVKVVDIDVVLDTKYLDFNLIRDIARLAPFGQKNKRPVFVYKNLKVVSVSTLKENKHLKFKLQDDNFTVDAIFFKAGDRRDEVRLGDKIDVVLTMNVNEFMGYKNIQFLLVDFKKSIN